jgi:hypothetical protein
MRDDLPDPIRQRRREQRDLFLFRHLLQDVFDVVDEPHAQHLVGFVDDHGLELVELQCFATQVILDPPRRADDGVHTAAQLLQLEVHALAAIDGQHVKPLEVTCIGLHRFGHLNRKLARRSQHEQLGLRALQVEPAQQRQCEGGRLARACLRLPEQIAPFEQRWNRSELNRRRHLVADFAHGSEHGLAQA